MSLDQSHEVWLGEMPSDWRRTRIRNVAHLSPGYSAKPPSAKEICTIVPMELLSNDGKIDVDNQQTADVIQSGLTLFERGDVLFAKITPCMENGKGAFVSDMPTRYGFGSTEFHVLRPRPGIEGSFLYYATFNPIYRAYAADNMTGAAGQKRVSSRFLKDTCLFLPSINEQRVITAYLDASCAAIDAAVKAKREQLETLEDVWQTILVRAVTLGLTDNTEFQETGSRVLPEVPESWRLTRLKTVADVRYGLGQPPAELSTGVAMLRATDIDAGVIRTDKLLRVDPDELPQGRNPYLKAGEILVVRSGAYTGDSAIVPPELEGSVAGYDMVVTVNRASARFVAYSLLSRYVLEGQIFLLTLRAAQPHLNAEELSCIRIALPLEKSAQEQIADFLDSKRSEMEILTSQIEQQIETLLSYRNSLIHECVTGQRRVTESDLNRIQSHVPNSP